MTEDFVSQILRFDKMSCDEDEDNSSEKSGATSSSTTHSGLLRKKLNFDFVDNCDLDYHEDNESENEENMEVITSSSKKRSFSSSSPISSSLNLTPSGYSPCRTRSGRIFKKDLNKANELSSSKPRSKRTKNFDRQSRIPTPIFNTTAPQIQQAAMPNNESKELSLLQRDLPPPLNYVKRPMSRIQSKFDIDRDRRASAPAAGNNILSFSGDSAIKKCKRPTNINPFTPNIMDQRKKPRLVSGDSSNNGSFETSFIHNVESINLNHELSMETESSPPKRLKVAEMNSPRYLEEFIEIEEIASGSFGTVKIARNRLDGMLYAIKVTRNQIHGNTHKEKVALNEIFAHAALINHKHVVRYHNSWVENGRVYIQNEYCEGGSLASRIEELRKSGQFFTEAELKRILLHMSKGLQYIHAKKLVHLDIKPENILISFDDTMCSPLRKEFEGDDDENLDNNSGNKVNVPVTPRGEAPANLTASAKALPTTTTEEELFSGNDSTDSGNHSGCNRNLRKTDNAGSRSGSVSGSPLDDRLSFKIGDLGHVSQIHGGPVPEEGDCRYMAPELLAMDINRELLTKSDIFSLGLTLYEAASLRELPKNSIEDPEYENLKAGQIPYLERYSKDFNTLLKAMVNPDPLARPSANRLSKLQSLRGTNSGYEISRFQLYQELREAKSKLRLLELELSLNKSSNSNNSTTTPGNSTQNNIAVSNVSADTPKSHLNPTNADSKFSKNLRLIGRGCGRSRSSNVLGSCTSTPKKW